MGIVLVYGERVVINLRIDDKSLLRILLVCRCNYNLGYVIQSLNGITGNVVLTFKSWGTWKAQLCQVSCRCTIRCENLRLWSQHSAERSKEGH